ncbi:nucleotidyl transferase AbiEii/AbiGii toxin family protein [bacterium]|jgi:predicted nucleotidyltransferase component of viral defense system|nr:nucleotidyl transferase AbiEii/AbiGii toxin family protein [bacterium]
MKDYVLELAAKQSGMNAKLNVMREYLQAYILRVMHDNGAFSNLAFVGGTALRFMHRLPRFSEDLDFSAENIKGLAFAELMMKIKEELSLAGYNAGVTFNDAKTVNSAFVKIKELMKDAGISPFAEQNISIKIEVDTNPPKGAVTETMVVNRYFPLSFLTYEKNSLFAGKVHAVLSREYTKGRDYFDLGWYLSKWPGIAPNIVQLDNALKQTGWKKEFPMETTWRNIVFEVASKVDWAKVKRDAENFLERPEDMSVFTKENILRLLRE